MRIRADCLPVEELQPELLYQLTRRSRPSEQNVILGCNLMCLPESSAEVRAAIRLQRYLGVLATSGHLRVAGSKNRYCWTGSRKDGIMLGKASQTRQVVLRSQQISCRNRYGASKQYCRSLGQHSTPHSSRPLMHAGIEIKGIGHVSEHHTAGCQLHERMILGSTSW